MDTAILRKLKDQVKKIITKENDNYIGVYINDDEIFCTQLSKDNSGSFKISYAERINIAGNSSEDRQYAIDELKNSFLKAGISNEKIIMCIDEEDVYYYHKEFPPIESKRLVSAIHWDIASNVPFQENYLESFYLENCDKNSYLLGAVDKGNLEEMQGLFADNNIDIISFVCNTDKNVVAGNGCVMVDNVSCQLPDYLSDYFIDNGQLLSLYASFAGFSSHGLEFSLEKKEGYSWDYLRLSACVIIISFVMIAVSAGFSLWQYYDVKADFAKVKQEYILMSDIYSSKQNMDEVNEKLKHKTNILQELSKSSWPVYALMVHLGCNTGEGTWLTDISAESDRDILLKGEAISYNNLVKYYQMLVADKEFFTGGAVLEKSDLSADGNIDFSIKLRL